MPTLLQHRAGTGTPLVLLHGLGADWRSWRPVLPQLEAHHDVLALDLPGHGAADPLSDVHPTVAALADAVEAQLDATGLDDAHLVGNSLGGRLAIELAVRGRARTLVAFAPSGMELPPERAWVFWGNQHLRSRARAVAPLRELVTAAPPSRAAALAGTHAHAWPLRPRDAAAEVETIARTPAFQETLTWAAMLDVPRGLARIACPARIAFGTADGLLGAVTAPRWAAAIPGADLVPLPGCGHVPMGDAPELVARTVLDLTAAPR